MKNNVDIHADDYALTINTSKELLDLMKEGLLDSVSIIANMSCFDECVDMLYKAIPSLPFLPLISVHLNFVEGKSLSLDDGLLAKNGMMSLSWTEVFFSSFTSKRIVLKEELKKEMKAQIDKVDAVVKKSIEIAKANNIPYKQGKIRIDSHQHIHSLPLVWNSLMETIKDNDYEIEYIRNPKEPFWVFVSKTNLWKTYRPVNFIKNILLNFFSYQEDKYCDSHNLNKMYMWGLVMSGKMDIDRIKELYPDMLNKANKDNRTLEILFHPGYTPEYEINNELAKDAVIDFYNNENRKIENIAVKNIKGITL